MSDHCTHLGKHTSATYLLWKTGNLVDFLNCNQIALLLCCMIGNVVALMRSSFRNKDIYLREDIFWRHWCSLCRLVLGLRLPDSSSSKEGRVCLLLETQEILVWLVQSHPPAADVAATVICHICALIPPLVTKI